VHGKLRTPPEFDDGANDEDEERAEYADHGGDGKIEGGDVATDKLDETVGRTVEEKEGD